MNIYIDENLASGLLAGILTRHNHSVVRPKAVDLLGASDPIHLKYAILKGLVTLTRDNDDFLELHELVISSGGQHPGILVIRSDKNAKNEMKPKHVALAIAKIQTSGITVTNQFLILNQWR